MSCLERDASSHFVNPKRELKNENLDLEVTRIRDSTPLSSMLPESRERNLKTFNINTLARITNRTELPDWSPLASPSISKPCWISSIASIMENCAITGQRDCNPSLIAFCLAQNRSSLNPLDVSLGWSASWWLYSPPKTTVLMTHTVTRTPTTMANTTPLCCRSTPASWEPLRRSWNPQSWQLGPQIRVDSRKHATTLGW